MDQVRVVHLTSIHPSEDTRIFLKECRTLAGAGYDVVLVAKGEHDRDMEGVRHAAFAPFSSRFRRFTTGLWRIFRLALRQKGDVYHFHDPDLMIVGLGLKLFGKRVIYDVHEGYSDSILDRKWIPGPLRAPISAATGLMENLAARAFDAIVTATPHIARSFPPAKTFVVCNYPLRDELLSESAIPFAERPPNFGYVGGMSRGRGIVELVQAADRAHTPDLRLHLAGNIPASLLADLERNAGWSKTVAHGFLSRSEVSKIYANVLGGLVVLLPLRNYVNSLPIKLFEYMSAGLPVIASDFPLWREIIEQHRCGILVDPAKPETTAAAMDALAQDRQEAESMGRRGRQAVLDRYNWECEAKTLLDCYARVLT